MSLSGWLGGDLADKVAEAAIAGIDDTTLAAAEDAKGTSMELPFHEAAGYFWFGSSARTEEAVTTKPAEEVAPGVYAGGFGSTAERGGYALFLERMNPYLRPAGDRNFTSLAENIRKHLEA